MRSVVGVAWLVAMAACRSEPTGPNETRDGKPPSIGASSAAASGAASDDVTPAVELTAPRPAYALDAVTDRQLDRIVRRTGWTPTIVGKSPAADARSVLRVAAFKKAGDQQLDAVIFVRCGAAAKHEPGGAYFKDGACELDVVVRLGIRAKSSESKRLLEALLGAPGT